MQSFEHAFTALRLFHGHESLQSLGAELDRVGSRRAVIFCGKSIARNTNCLDLVRAALGPRYAGVFDGVMSHSPLLSVRSGMQFLATQNADAVIAVGGGSAIVTARASSILLAEGDDARQLCTQRSADGSLKSPRLNAAKLPQFVIPTTPTTACVKAGSAVFDADTGQRLAFFDPKTRAQALFIHPQLACSAPPQLVQTASLNTLTMAIEGLESLTGDPIVDALLLHSIRLLAENLPLLGSNQDDGAMRGQLIIAALMCGQGTDFAGGGIAAVLSHSIGARFHLNNGLLGSMILPHSMRFNEPITAKRIEKVAYALRDLPFNIHSSDSAIDLVEQLLDTLNIPKRLRDLGVTQDTFNAIAEEAMLNWFLQSNPRKVNEPGTLTQLLQQAW